MAEGEIEESDRTGTNPVNFQKDIRLYNEYSWLNSAGDGSQNMTTLELRSPFAGGKWQWRMRARYNMIKADLNGDGIYDLDKSGMGDLDMRFLTIPVLDIPNKQAWAVGLELFFNTASEDALGSGTTSLGPQIVYVKFLEHGLFAPAIQYKFSIHEDSGRSETDQVLIDLNYLQMAEDKQSWFFTNPKTVIDNEHNLEYALVDFEFGWMMTNWYPEMKGHSFYIRPSFGIGHDRPKDGSLELGYKIIGW